MRVCACPSQLGVIAFGYITSSIRQFSSASRAVEAQSALQHEALQNFLHEHRVPPSICRETRHFFEYYAKRKKLFVSTS
eukprot:1832915-Pleurochrysis_carterae.AAC.2